MIVDRQSFRSTMESKVHCVWVEAGERNHAFSREGELYAVHGDGTPRTHDDKNHGR
jgi:hypothetical protein